MDSAWPWQYCPPSITGCWRLAPLKHHWCALSPELCLIQKVHDRMMLQLTEIMVASHLYFKRCYKNASTDLEHKSHQIITKLLWLPDFSQRWSVWACNLFLTWLALPAVQASSKNLYHMPKYRKFVRTVAIIIKLEPFNGDLYIKDSSTRNE